MLCTMGEKRGLAQRLSEDPKTDPANVVADGMLVAAAGRRWRRAAFCWLVPAPMFPSGDYTELDRLLRAGDPARYALTEIVLAAQAYRFDIATTVRARVDRRAVDALDHGAAAAVVRASRMRACRSPISLSIYAALATALWPFLQELWPAARLAPAPAPRWAG